MVYRQEEVVNKVQRLLADVETEVVEYKSAKNNFDFDDLGKYFSALSNEANLRHADAGWLLFGVRNDRTICGTGYRKEAHEPSIGLRKLKHEMALYTNSGMTFEEIYELTIDRPFKSLRPYSRRLLLGRAFLILVRTNPSCRCRLSS